MLYVTVFRIFTIRVQIEYLYCQVPFIFIYESKISILQIYWVLVTASLSNARKLLMNSMLF